MAGVRLPYEGSSKTGGRFAGFRQNARPKCKTTAVLLVFTGRAWTNFRIETAVHRESLGEIRHPDPLPSNMRCSSDGATPGRITDCTWHRAQMHGCWSCPARRKSTGKFSERFAADRPFEHVAACGAGQTDSAQASRILTSPSRTDAKPLTDARLRVAAWSLLEFLRRKVLLEERPGSRTPTKDPATQPAALMASDQTNGSSSRKLRVP